MIKNFFLLLGTFLIAIVNFLAFVGVFGWNSTKKASVFYLLISLVILMFYIILLFILRKKISRNFLVVNFVLYIIIFANGPQIQNYGIEITYYFQTPSNQVQKQLIKEVADVIEKTNIPYKIHTEKSKNLTKERKEIVVALIRTTTGDLQKEEINKIILKPYSRDLTLSFYNRKEERIVKFQFTKLGEIEFCYPFDECENIGINYMK